MVSSAASPWLDVVANHLKIRNWRQISHIDLLICMRADYDIDLVRRGWSEQEQQHVRNNVAP